MPARLVITVPVPPSVNNYYAVVRGRKITSKAGREWQVAATEAVITTEKLRQFVCPVKVAATWYRARKAGDLSNRIKPVEDILVKTGVLLDDSQIADLHWTRAEDKAKPRVEVTITPMESQP